MSRAAAEAGRRRRLTTVDWGGLGVLVVFLIVGLSGSKWMPYWAKAWTLGQTSVPDGSPLFEAAGETFALAGA